MPTTAYEPVPLAFPSLRPTMVSIEPGCTCNRPASKCESTTPTCNGLYCTAWGTQQSSTDGTSYSRARLANLSAMGPLPYGTQMATSAHSMATDIATLAKVILNMLLKHQQRIIQGEFIDLSELLQADFQFKYASIESNNAFELVYKDVTILMQPRKKGKQIDCLGTWLSAWVLYEQVMVYIYPKSYPELAYYRNFIMQQDKKFIWSTVQMYNIRFWAMCTHHSCPFTTLDQVLMAIILDTTAVNTSACKCFRCGEL